MTIIAVRWHWSNGTVVHTEDFPAAAAARRWIRTMALAAAKHPNEASVIIVQKIGF